VRQAAARGALREFIMSLLERLFSIGIIRKAIWRLWYPFLTRRLRGEEVLFLNYAFEAEPPVGLTLSPKDEPNRACIQLYHHVASQVDLRGKEVLEVSCGHGGGASWITRSLQPASYTGLDLNPTGIRFCQRRHQVAGLQFIQGDAQRLSFRDGSLDAVINVEASHCYPDFSGFLGEVARVLRPGGHFLYADFRFSDEIAAWESAIAGAPLDVVQGRDIGAEVLRGMEANADRSLRLVRERLPRFLHSMGRDFAGIPGSRIYTALKSGGLSYRSWCFRKP
jgi:SAM-dependent methyltransferase